ncbi:hypothetical protein NQZ79_g8695 [Umbelopsis isabellina]|nr:hypothetical protein NQZ79_g8695 [Umbelopsis isabellina]
MSDPSTNEKAPLPDPVEDNIAADNEKQQQAGKITFQPTVKPERTAKPTPSEQPSRRPSIAAVPQPAKKETKNVDITEHLLTPEECAQKYGTQINMTKPGDSRGLTSEAAAKTLQETGPNVLSPPKKRHPILKYLDSLTSLFNLLLILAGVLEYVLLGIDFKGNFQNTYLGAILIAVAFLNAFIEFYQQQKSQALLESFLNLIPTKCMVIRDGKLQQFNAAELVVGDVVFIRMGDKTPADLYIYNASELKADNSSLTGESDPQERVPTNEHKNPLEATNLMFNGTLAVAGEGYGVVVRTGDNTVLGQIAGMTSGEDKIDSPLSVEIDNFVKIIAAIALITALVFFGISFPVNNNNVSLALNFAIGVFVAWVPEGLPATVTILLTIAAKRMAARNVLVKDLQGVETLGAITLLATDKTGTLTRNQMTVTYVWSCLNMYSAFRSMGNDDSVVTNDSPGISEIMHNATLNTRAKFDRTDVPVNDRQILGDATETGLIRFAGNSLPDFDQLPDTYPKVFEIPFNSDNKWALTIHKKKHADGSLTLYLKGAPERVLRICNRILIGSNGESTELTDDHNLKFQQSYEMMASKGHRVLAFAQMLLPESQYPEDFQFSKKDKNYPTDGFTFVGLASLEDPPKHGVREAIGKCREAGIKIMMVTGDHPLTAEAIGRKINLVLSDTKEMVAKRTGRPIEEIGEDEYRAIVIHGEKIDSLTDEEWDNIFMKSEIIFARTSPKHKLEIVKRAQSMGHIVGVTGDGVNDSPALKKADLGIAMNISGSDVSKEAASMILLDDNFASVVHGIEEGRLIFANLKKSIQYTITHSMPEVIPNLLYVIVPLPLPLSAILILVIDLGFELFAALTFAWDRPETAEGLMKMQPRKPVTPESIDRFRARAHRRAHPIDPESGEAIVPGRLSRWAKTIRSPLTKIFWQEKFEKTDDEVLVDFPLLSWAYLEVGIIEAIGSLVTYFVVLWYNGITPYDARIMQKGNGSPTFYFQNDGNYAVPYTTQRGFTLDAEAQHKALAQAQSMVYFAIMIQQMFNLFACKTRYTLPLPFSMYAFSNWRTFLGIFGGVGLGVLIVYCPPFNIPFGSEWHTSPLWWLIPMGFGCLIIAYACVRMSILRKTNPVAWNPEISGLQMYPTIRSFDRSKSINQ